MKNRSKIIFGILLLGSIVACTQVAIPEPPAPAPITEKATQAPSAKIRVGRSVQVRDYFAFMDSLITRLDTASQFELTEYILVHANPWIMSRLANTDYYWRKAQGIPTPDQSICTILRANDSLIVPNRILSEKIQDKLDNTILDLNLPEFLLRVLEGDSIKYAFPVRIGQNRSKYLAMAGHTVDLRTHTGVGNITRISKDPAYINPSNNRVYRTTRRDDGVSTKLPTIPWLEPTINGIRYGQLIHPTTNPITLGKTSSNGCIGTKESDAWYIYYHAPLGTKIIIRYDLNIIDSQGDTISLPDVYPGRKKQSALKATQAALPMDLIKNYLIDCPTCS